MYASMQYHIWLERNQCTFRRIKTIATKELIQEIIVRFDILTKINSKDLLVSVVVRSR